MTVCTFSALGWWAALSNCGEWGGAAAGTVVRSVLSRAYVALRRKKRVKSINRKLTRLWAHTSSHIGTITCKCTRPPRAEARHSSHEGEA